MSIVALALPLVCPAGPPAAGRTGAPPRLALPLVGCPSAGRAAAVPPGRFAKPPWDRDSPDWRRLDADLPADHLARQLDRAADQLDLAGLYQGYAGTGSPAHRPDLLLKVALFEARRGRHSPGQWFQDLREHGPCQWLALGLRPSRARLYAFRDRLGPLLEDLHAQLVGQAVAQGVTPAQRAALDGSTAEANTTRHRLLNEEGLAKRQAALAEAAAADEAGAPPGEVPGWMAATPAGRQAQQQRYAAAGEQLALRQRENAARAADKRLEPGQVRVSPGDPEAALGLDKLKVYRPLYNVQLMPDLDSRLVLAWDVFAQASDAGTLGPMLGRFRRAAGHHPQELLADASYATALDLAACARAGVVLYSPYQENSSTPARRARKPPKQVPKEEFTWVEAEGVYVCPQGHRLACAGSEAKPRKGGARLRVFTYRCDPAHCSACPRQKECTTAPDKGRTVKRHEHEHLVEELKGRMQTGEAKALYKLRSQVVELSFADTKQHRGLRRLSGRGLARARIEVGLAVIAHNALELLAARQDSCDDEPPVTPERSTA